MKPEKHSATLLSITRSKAKMFEYDVPENEHIDIPRDPSDLFPLTIGLLGELSAKINSNADTELLQKHKASIRFASFFFDSLYQTKLRASVNPYLLLLGSSAYYLSDLPGSASVLAKKIDVTALECEVQGLDTFLLWLLNGNFSQELPPRKSRYVRILARLSDQIIEYQASGTNVERLFEVTDVLRKVAYAGGSARDLLFADVIAAITRKRYLNSAWHCLPKYSGLPMEVWAPTITKDSFIREFWPAQHLIGKKGILQGKSATIQMPTSAGKTRATEIIIRSAFLSERANTCVIVAPFRALCHEIKNALYEAFDQEDVSVDELSDVPQDDMSDDLFVVGKQILVVTPEKLVYVLRHSPELASKIGIVIYDEGHQFDSGSRGITYELLLTSLKRSLPENVQTVLISAVIRNAESINEWLNGEGSVVASGADLLPTYRTIAFTSWPDVLGRLEFVRQSNPEKGEFYVPRVIEQHELKLKRKETRERKFPEKNDSSSIALYLGLKLVKNGGVAVFCGRKSTASGLCDEIVDVVSRQPSNALPVDYSNIDEVRALYSLHERNLGVAAPATKASRIGIFAHHGNIPQGLRLSVEHAMKEGLIRFVICTSTLAQGVNLPIKYLIVTGVYQGTERISVRDFHNLIGRAGRSGMHTEGSIIFADPSIYDNRANGDQDTWRWNQFKKLLEPNTEPCISMLFSIFTPLESDDGKQQIIMKPLDFAETYVSDRNSLETISEELSKKFSADGFSIDGLKYQVQLKLNALISVESFLMSHWDLSSDHSENLAKSTLAYHIGSNEQKEQLVELFKILTENIEKKIESDDKRAVYGKTLFGIYESHEIEKWFDENELKLSEIESYDDILNIVWPLLEINLEHKVFKKCSDRDLLKQVIMEWTHGTPYYELFKIMKTKDVRLGDGKRPRKIQLDHIVDLCENAIGYEAVLLIGAVISICEMKLGSDAILLENLKRFQKRMKYGLPVRTSIALYEIGFSDRVIATELYNLLGSATSQHKAKEALREKEREARVILSQYPSYFMQRLDDIV